MKAACVIYVDEEVLRAVRRMGRDHGQTPNNVLRALLSMKLSATRRGRPKKRKP